MVIHIFHPRPYSRSPVGSGAKKQATQKSIKKGELLFNTYCIACHGVDGKATTPVALFRGGVVPIDAILADPTITDGYLFHKITYGGIGDIGMPPFGYSTTEKESGIW